MIVKLGGVVRKFELFQQVDNKVNTLSLEILIKIRMENDKLKFIFLPSKIAF